MKLSLGLWVVVLGLLCGCGYHVGSLMHPQIGSIGIAEVANESLSYNISAEMRQLLNEQFMVDSSMKLVDVTQADCIIYVRIKEVKFSEVTSSAYNTEYSLFMPTEWRATVNAEYSVVIPGQKTPLVKRCSISGSADFQAPGDLDPHRRRGIQQACRSVAIKIVESVTEAW